MTSRPAGYHSHQMAKCSTEHLYSALYLRLFCLFVSEFQIQLLMKKDSSSIAKRQCSHLAIDFSKMYLGVFFYCQTCMGDAAFLEQVDLSQDRQIWFGRQLGLATSEQCRDRGNKRCTQLAGLGMASSSCLLRKRVGFFLPFFFFLLYKSIDHNVILKRVRGDFPIVMVSYPTRRLSGPSTICYPAYKGSPVCWIIFSQLLDNILVLGAKESYYSQTVVFCLLKEK